MNLQNYLVEDLVSDPDFVLWVKKPRLYNGALWENWASLNANNAKIVEEARQLVLLLSSDDELHHRVDLDEVWDKINLSIYKEDTEKPIAKFWHWRSRIAAAVVVFLLAGAAIAGLLMDKVTYKTSFGENRRIVLPDHSVLLLNANSVVRYSGDWGKDEIREVWLEGEGFFSVKHEANVRKFIVHTSDLDVQVVGTRFNVNTRHERTQVVLNSGKVKLFFNAVELDMRPGDLVDFSSASGRVAKQQVQVQRYSSWVHKKMVFEDTSLGEIARTLEDNYGYKIQFTDPALTKLTFTGTFDTDNADQLLTIFQKTFDITLKKEGRSIIISH